MLDLRERVARFGRDAIPLEGDEHEVDDLGAVVLLQSLSDLDGVPPSIEKADNVPRVGPLQHDRVVVANQHRSLGRFDEMRESVR
jgi:hypothetical protein